MIAVFTDKFHKVESKRGEPYWRFNVYVEHDPGVAFLSVGWSYRNGKTHPPYQVIDGKFFTTLRVSRDVAKAIYKDAIRKIADLEGNDIPFHDKMWRSPIIGQSSFIKVLPAYYQEKWGAPPEYGEKDEKSPYPHKLTFDEMNDPFVRPSWIPISTVFTNPDCEPLRWSRNQWKEYAKYVKNKKELEAQQPPPEEETTDYIHVA